MKKNKIDKFIQFFNKQSVKYSFFSILLGILVGGFILLIAGFNPIKAYWIIFTGVFSRPSYISYTIIKATPLIITGLSIAFAFKTGLFNIGAEGQFIIGALFAALSGYFLNLPSIIHVPVVILISVSVSALWGGFAGYLKAKMGIHEVISTIMLNWIALYLQNYFALSPFFNKPNSEVSQNINSTASLTILENWKMSESGIAWLNNHPFVKDLLRTPVNPGIIFAIILAIGIWYLLNKTTLGYRLKAVGYNKYAAEYSGINVKKYIIISMAISGAISGFAGCLHVICISKNIANLAAMEGYGFNGIAAALIGNNDPFGTILGGFLFGALQYGSTKLQSTLRAPSELVDIVIGSIIFFVALPKMMSIFFNFLKKEEDNV